VGQAVLPAYRSKISKRHFRQPELLAMLCLMRYEDWSVREAEVRLAEHAELPPALGWRHVRTIQSSTDFAAGSTRRPLNKP
jgi:hypothetical protein